MFSFQHLNILLYFIVFYSPYTETPMLEDADEGGVRMWHLVKASEEPELPKHRRGSLKEREKSQDNTRDLSHTVTVNEGSLNMFTCPKDKSIKEKSNSYQLCTTLSSRND